MFLNNSLLKQNNRDFQFIVLYLENSIWIIETKFLLYRIYIVQVFADVTESVRRAGIATKYDKQKNQFTF